MPRATQELPWRRIDLQLRLPTVVMKALAHDFPLGKRQTKGNLAMARQWMAAFAQVLRCDHDRNAA